jgi:hypothetical protein
MAGVGKDFIEGAGEVVVVVDDENLPLHRSARRA